MITVISGTVPQGALLRRHAVLPGAQSDAHRVTVAARVSLADFVTAFFTSRAFLPEALILRLMLRRPTGRAAVTALIEGHAQQFAAWRVETRDAGQLLMAVGTGPIRSWLWAEPLDSGETRLWFGSTILPVATGARVPAGFRLLNRFHLIYARILLRGAVKTLRAPAETTRAR